MPHPSAYDPEIDDHVELQDESWKTLTLAQMQEMMTDLRNRIVEAHLASQKADEAGR